METIFLVVSVFLQINYVFTILISNFTLQKQNLLSESERESSGEDSDLMGINKIFVS